MEVWPIFAVAHVARTNGASAAAEPTLLHRVEHRGRGRAVQRAAARRPATSSDQRSASACICARDVNSRPRQKLSRMYGIGRSILALSLGFSARAGSMRHP